MTRNRCHFSKCNMCVVSLIWAIKVMSSYSGTIKEVSYGRSTQSSARRCDVRRHYNPTKYSYHSIQLLLKIRSNPWSNHSLLIHTACFMQIKLHNLQWLRSLLDPFHQKKLLLSKWIIVLLRLELGQNRMSWPIHEGPDLWIWMCKTVGLQVLWLAHEEKCGLMRPLST